MRTVHLLERGHVAPRDVHDVDVVAAARAVLRVEVAAVHEQLHSIAGKMYEHQSWYKKHADLTLSRLPTATWDT